MNFKNEYLANIRMSGKLLSSGWEIVDPCGANFPQILTSRKLNEYLSRGGDFKLVVGGEYINPWEGTKAEVIARKINEGKHLFNGAKLRMASDPDCSLSELGFERTDYFNGVVTNDATFDGLRAGAMLDVAYPNGLIQSLGDSVLSNHIGVAALVIDQDGLIVFCKTTSASMVEGGRLTAGASGSVDLGDAASGDSLVRLLESAVLNEARDELGITPETEMRVSVTAFYRDLNRGGKPEFAAVVYVPFSLSDVMSSLSEQEKAFTETHEFLNFRRVGPNGLQRWLKENAERSSTALIASTWTFLNWGRLR